MLNIPSACSMPALLIHARSAQVVLACYSSRARIFYRRMLGSRVEFLTKARECRYVAQMKLMACIPPAAQNWMFHKYFAQKLNNSTVFH